MILHSDCTSSRWSSLEKARSSAVVVECVPVEVTDHVGWSLRVRPDAPDPGDAEVFPRRPHEPLLIEGLRVVHRLRRRRRGVINPRGRRRWRRRWRRMMHHWHRWNVIHPHLQCNGRPSCCARPTHDLLTLENLTIRLELCTCWILTLVCFWQTARPPDIRCTQLQTTGCGRPPPDPLSPPCVVGVDAHLWTGSKVRESMVPGRHVDWALPHDLTRRCLDYRGGRQDRPGRQATRPGVIPGPTQHRSLRWEKADVVHKRLQKMRERTKYRTWLLVYGPTRSIS